MFMADGKTLFLSLSPSHCTRSHYCCYYEISEAVSVARALMITCVCVCTFFFIHFDIYVTIFVYAISLCVCGFFLVNFFLSHTFHYLHLNGPLVLWLVRESIASERKFYN